MHVNVGPETQQTESNQLLWHEQVASFSSQYTFLWICLQTFFLIDAACMCLLLFYLLVYFQAVKLYLYQYGCIYMNILKCWGSYVYAIYLISLFCFLLTPEIAKFAFFKNRIPSLWKTWTGQCRLKVNVKGLKVTDNVADN